MKAERANCSAAGHSDHFNRHEAMASRPTAAQDNVCSILLGPRCSDMEINAFMPAGQDHVRAVATRSSDGAAADLTASCGASRFRREWVLMTRACASCEQMLCKVPRGTLRGRHAETSEVRHKRGLRWSPLAQGMLHSRRVDHDRAG